MRSTAWAMVVIVLGWSCAVPRTVAAQQATVSTPNHAVGDRFFENTGVHWGFTGKGWSFSFGSPTQAAPPFGGFDPSAGASLNFRRSNGNGLFGAHWSQGFRQSDTSVVPIVTLPHGGWGGFYNASIRPFVVGQIPVVGGFPVVRRVEPPAPSPLSSFGVSGVGRDAVVDRLREAQSQHEPVAAPVVGAVEPDRPKPAHDGPPPAPPFDEERGGPALADAVAAPGLLGDRASDDFARKLGAARDSSAGRAAPSVAEARRLHAAEQTGDGGDAAAAFLQRARAAEARGKPNVARVYYENAAKRASGQLREEIVRRIEAMDADTHAR